MISKKVSLILTTYNAENNLKKLLIVLKILKREVYEKYGLYKTDYRIAADYEFMVRFLNENRIAYIPETLISMYYGGTSSNGIGSYFRSFTEGNRALRENGYRLCLGISVLRTVRVLLQFRLM